MEPGKVNVLMNALRDAMTVPRVGKWMIPAQTHVL
jgi:hypothetical protein